MRHGSCQHHLSHTIYQCCLQKLEHGFTVACAHQLLYTVFYNHTAVQWQSRV